MTRCVRTLFFIQFVHAIYYVTNYLTAVLKHKRLKWFGMIKWINHFSMLMCVSVKCKYIKYVRKTGVFLFLFQIYQKTINLHILMYINRIMSRYCISTDGRWPIYSTYIFSHDIVPLHVYTCVPFRTKTISHWRMRP